MCRYDRLPHPVFSDTMKAGTRSKKMNTHAQAYCTTFGWTRCFPTEKESCAHETLSLMFKRDGVPSRMIVDNSKTKSFGKFKEKCNEADCHLVNTEPYSPWQQAAEGSIKHLKTGSSRKIIRTATPKPLWDHCIELESQIRSHTALDIYGLECQAQTSTTSLQ